MNTPLVAYSGPPPCQWALSREIIKKHEINTEYIFKKRCTGACSRPLRRVHGLKGVFTAFEACSRLERRVHGLKGVFTA